MGNCINSESISPNVEPTNVLTDISHISCKIDDIHLYEPKTKQVSVPFLKQLIENNDKQITYTLINKSVFEIADIIETIREHIDASFNYENEMYRYGKSNIRVYFSSIENGKLLELVKMLMKYKKLEIIKRAQNECRDLSDQEKLELLL